ncbi:UNVERIFIED_CONTAM: hypothetical protein PYX00_005152 [Menopon gallinae]|uniref:carbonic anhydrase n=1 Tax=Menopon gallinae TaxID=328185 RepID=A0AAW2HQ20_9NEOP
MSQSFILYFIFYILFFTFIIQSGSSLRVEREVWSYKNPDSWTGLCKSGKRQSPVDIEEGSAGGKKTNFLAFHFGRTYDIDLSFKAVNDGTTLVITTVNRTRPYMEGGGLSGRFIFKEIRLHWDAEHSINGVRDPLEVQFIHFNSKFKDVESARKNKNGIVILSVLCEEKIERNKMTPFIRGALEQEEHRRLYNDNQELLLHKVITKLRNLLPASILEFYRYEGSMTSPGCEENVVWTIFRKKMVVHPQTIMELKAMKTSANVTMPKSSRPVQPLNGRDVVLGIGNLKSDTGGAVVGMIKEKAIYIYLMSILYIIMNIK